MAAGPEPSAVEAWFLNQLPKRRPPGAVDTDRRPAADVDEWGGLLVLLADLPRLERASRRANTRARLGLCWAVALRVAGRLLPAELALRLLLSDRVGADSR